MNIDKILKLAQQVENTPIENCAPSDDSDKQYAYTCEFRDLAIKFIAAIKRTHNSELSELLIDLNTDISDDIRDAHKLKAHLIPVIDALRDVIDSTNRGQSNLINLSRPNNKNEQMEGRKFAVIIAIENYCTANKPQITKVNYALNDANAIKKAFIEQLEIDERNILFWVENNANKNTISTELSYTIKQLGSNDEFYFYYAGHGFYSGATNKLTCWDTHIVNLEQTSICVKKNLLDPLRESHCHKSFIFIDACADKILNEERSRTIVSKFNEKEFNDFIKQSHGHSCFFSCKPGEKSYPSSKDKQGIWTLHLLKALNGLADGAIDNYNIVTNISLAEYLSHEVPKFITKETTLRGSQTPYHLIENTSRSKLIEFTEDEEDIENNQVNIDFTAYKFLKEESTPFKDFAGFSKRSGHTIPTNHNNNADSWAKRLAKEIVKEEIEDLYNNARRPLRLKNSNCDKDPEDGTLHTEYFRYDIDVTQSEEDCTEVKITRSLELRAPTNKFPCDIDDIFTNGFNSITFPIYGSIDIDKIEDSLYDLEDADKGRFENKGDIFIFYPNGIKEISSIDIDTANNSFQIQFRSSSTSVTNVLEFTKESLILLSAPIRGLIEY